VENDLSHIHNQEDDLQSDIESIASRKQKELTEQRETFVRKLEKDGSRPHWMDGMTDVSLASTDLLIVTMVYPR